MFPCFVFQASDVSDQEQIAMRLLLRDFSLGIAGRVLSKLRRTTICGSMKLTLPKLSSNIVLGTS